MKATNTNPCVRRPSHNVDFVYKNPRPQLVIESNGGVQLGNCYSASYFTVTSLRPLDMEALLRLRAMGDPRDRE